MTWSGNFEQVSKSKRDPVLEFQGHDTNSESVMPTQTLVKAPTQELIQVHSTTFIRSLVDTQYDGHSAVTRHVMIVLSDGEGIFNRCDPLGARCVMGALEQTGHTFTAMFQDRLESRESILENVSKLDSSAIWISVQPNTTGIGKFVHDLSLRTAAPIVLGNVGARFLKQDDFSGVPNPVIVTLGQGETTAVLLAQIFENPQAKWDYSRLLKIPNLKWFDADGTVVTESRPSELAKSVVPSSSFLEEAIIRNDIISARSSSGCNARCTFCTVLPINNGQGWQRSSTSALEKWLSYVVRAGKTDGKITLVDDDLAGSLKNLEAVAKSFAETNHKFGADLQFCFSTRANHLIDPEDSALDTNRRKNAWRVAVESGLEGIFLGLESGSESQLRRHGKGYRAEINFRAVSFANKLGINVEIGFIPLDAFMEDGVWRDEMRDNLRLARHCDVAKRSPTWLAPARVYRESPLLRWIDKSGLLGTEIYETGEFSFRYRSAEVRQFIEDIGPCLCTGSQNGLHRFKRELKSIQRYPVYLLELSVPLGEHIINLELDFVQRIIDARTRGDVHNAQVGFIEQTVNSLQELAVLLERTSLNHGQLLRQTAEEAMETVIDWSRSIIATSRPMDGRFPVTPAA